MAINQVIYEGRVLLDLTNDTVDAAHLAKDYIAHDRSGTQIVGTMEGGGGGKNVQCYAGWSSVKSTTMKTTTSVLTCAKSGTYTAKIICRRGSSVQSAYVQLYINGAAYDSAVKLASDNALVTFNNVSLSQNDVVAVYAKAGSSTYTTYVASLILEEV